MKPTKKEIEEAKTAAEKVEKSIKEPEVKMTHIDELWDELHEMGKDLKRVMDRMGL